MIQVYNTLTRKKEPFVPLEAGKVKMYVCGPTVYNYIHIGNARSAVAFDTIRRYFEYRGFEVNYVSNFTDVDDKIIRVAKEEGKTPAEIAEYFIDAYRQDTAELNVRPATTHPQVVQNIPEIIEFITGLIEKGYAYVSSGDVYYRTRKFANYGQLSDQTIDELEVGASQRTGQEAIKKEDPLDFALWKAAKEAEIAWQAPWGLGRPGWHIECSVMVNKYLGETIDIHGGGQDLEFPHHENEIAQSEAQTGHPFVHYWMHNGFVTAGSEKMSKSLGNFVTARELLAEQPADVVRFALVTTQYRRPLPFNEKMLQEASVNLKKIKTAYQNVAFRQAQALTETDNDALDLAELSTLEAQFITEMDDDFNTANGITVVYELVKWLNRYAERENTSVIVGEQALTQLRAWLSIFGIELSSSPDMLATEVEALLAEREQARKAKDFARSDAIRDALIAEGIILEDTPQGTRWRRAD